MSYDPENLALDAFRFRTAEGIVRERKAAKISVTELSRRSGISRTLIHRWESGMYLPSLFNAERLAQALRVPITRLIEGETPARCSITSSASNRMARGRSSPVAPG